MTTAAMSETTVAACLEELKEMPPEVRYEPWHDLRYAYTVATLEAHGMFPMDGAARTSVLELGGSSPLTRLLESRGCVVAHTPLDTDLREWAGRTEPVDLVLCTEVIEHIHDLPTRDHDARAMWTGGGQLKVMREAIRSGRACFVTTPNACSAKVVYHACVGHPPRNYTPHVRELTAHELNSLIDHAGGEIVDGGEWEVWKFAGMTPQQESKARLAMRSFGVDPRGRGDDLWRLCKVKGIK